MILSGPLMRQQFSNVDVIKLPATRLAASALSRPRMLLGEASSNFRDPPLVFLQRKSESKQILFFLSLFLCHTHTHSQPPPAPYSTTNLPHSESLASTQLARARCRSVQCIMGTGTKLCLPLIPTVSSQINMPYRRAPWRVV